MNFKEACQNMLNGKAVRRGLWSDRRCRMNFGPSGRLQGSFDGENWSDQQLYKTDFIATDWEIYVDADYQCNHTLEWAIEQMQAGKYCTIGNYAKYAIRNNELIVAGEDTVLCSFSLNFLKPIWGLYKEP